MFTGDLIKANAVETILITASITVEQFYVLILWCPNLSTVLEVRLCQHRATSGPVPSIAWLAVLGLMHSRALCWLDSTCRQSEPPRSLSVGLLSSLSSHSLYIARVARCQVPKPVSGLVKHHAIGDCPTLWLVEVSAFQYCIEGGSELCVCNTVFSYGRQPFNSVKFWSLENGLPGNCCHDLCYKTSEVLIGLPCPFTLACTLLFSVHHWYS